MQFFKNCIFGENLEHFVQYPIPHMCAFILVVVVVVVYVVVCIVIKLGCMFLGHCTHVFILTSKKSLLILVRLQNKSKQF